MADHRYRLSTTERADTLLRLLDLDDTFRASRPIGYAYTRVVDVEHPDGVQPDALVYALDPLARLERIYPDTRPQSLTTGGHLAQAPPTATFRAA